MGPVMTASEESVRVFPDLVDHLARGQEPGAPDRVIARTLATASAYCYSDELAVLRTGLSRLGMDNATAQVTQRIDTMLIYTTAFLSRSNDGRVGILTYRGTVPTSPINIVLDFD